MTKWFSQCGQFAIGQPVRVSSQSDCHPDWGDTELWIAEVAYDKGTGSLKYATCEQWPPDLRSDGYTTDWDWMELMERHT